MRVEFCVDTQGKTTDLHAATGRSWALASRVRDWRFKPHVVDGRVVPSCHVAFILARPDWQLNEHCVEEGETVRLADGELCATKLGRAGVSSDLVPRGGPSRWPRWKVPIYMPEPACRVRDGCIRRRRPPNGDVVRVSFCWGADGKPKHVRATAPRARWARLSEAAVQRWRAKAATRTGAPAENCLEALFLFRPDWTINAWSSKAVTPAGGSNLEYYPRPRRHR